MIREGLRFVAALWRCIRHIQWNLVSGVNVWRTLKVFNGISIKLILLGDITRILFEQQHLVRFKKSFEYQTLEWVVRNLKTDSVFVDVGANIGLFSIVGSRFNENGKVLAFEPTAETFQTLRRNVELNKCQNAVLYQIALADRIMPVVMVNPKSSSYGDAFNRIKEARDIENEKTIWTTTFDQFVDTNEIDRIDILKVDIEGAELLFFKGAEKSLKKWKPKIIFEANEAHTQNFDYKIIDLLIYLHSLNYSLTQLNQEQWIAE